MKRAIFLGLVVCLVGLAGKAQGQKAEKVDGMLYRIIGTDEVALVGGDIKTWEYMVPSRVTIDGKEYTVTELQNQSKKPGIASCKAEQYGKTVRKMVLPNTIREIGWGAFYYHPNLETVVLPLSLDKIGYSAFWHCTSLRRLEGLNSGILFVDIDGWDWVPLEKLIENGDAYDSFDTFNMCTSLSLKEIMGSFSYYALGKIKTGLKEWQEKKPFETVAQWQGRVTAGARDKKVQEWLAEAEREYMEKYMYSDTYQWSCTLKDYDSDYHVLVVDYGYMASNDGNEIADFGTHYVEMPEDAVEQMTGCAIEDLEKTGWTFMSILENVGNAVTDGKKRSPGMLADGKLPDKGILPRFGIKDDRLAVTGVEVKVSDRTYYSKVAVEEGSQPLLAQLPALDIDLGQGDVPAGGQQDAAVAVSAQPADVDRNIPVTGTVADKTFAVVIANEEYTREARVPFALRDGEVFAEYCRKTLGIPEKNIRVVRNATLNDMKFQLNWLAQVLGTYNGTARAIVYYAGHGIPDEADKGAYLLPVDGYGSDVSTGYALKDFYAALNGAPAESVTVFLDACFSGAKRESGMMASARGVAIKVKEEAPQGKMVVFTAAQGDETAYQYAEKGHGMFTYFLLKKLQETRGEVTLGELGDYLRGEVKRESLLNNNKAQTPTVIPAAGMTGWREWRLK